MISPEHYKPRLQDHRPGLERTLPIRDGLLPVQATETTSDSKLERQKLDSRHKPGLTTYPQGDIEDSEAGEEGSLAEEATEKPSLDVVARLQGLPTRLSIFSASGS